MRCGLGAATAHALYATVAVLGVGRASGLLTARTSPVRLVGGFILVGLGLRLGLGQPRRRPHSAVGAYAITLALGLANPLTLLYFAAALTLGAFPVGAGPLVVAGVFAGSAAWWTALVHAVATVGNRLDQRRLAWANRLVAAAMAVFGVLAVASAV